MESRVFSYVRSSVQLVHLSLSRNSRDNSRNLKLPSSNGRIVISWGNIQWALQSHSFLLEQYITIFLMWKDGFRPLNKPSKPSRGSSRARIVCRRGWIDHESNIPRGFSAIRSLCVNFASASVTIDLSKTSNNRISRPCIDILLESRVPVRAK